MCNQTTNLTQWKNLTDDEKAAFDFEGYDYLRQGDVQGNGWFRAIGEPNRNYVYRLKIEPEKWYYCEWPEDGIMISKGSEILGVLAIENADLVRPAKPSEIPEQEPSLEDEEDRLLCWIDGEVLLSKQWISHPSIFKPFSISDIEEFLKRAEKAKS